MISSLELQDLKTQKKMNKALIIAKREYRAAVRTKGFLIALILLPVFMGGGLIVFTLFKDKVDVNDKRIAVIDHSGLFEDYLAARAESWNSNNIIDENGNKISPAYFFEFVKPDGESPAHQKVDLSNRIRRKEIHAFIQIGKHVLHPKPGDEESGIYYYGENSAIDNVRNWINNILNERIRELRLMEIGIDQKSVSDLFYWVNAEPMGLASMDTKTGEVLEGKRTDELQTIFVPYALMLLMFMMLMMTAVPLLTSVMEEKSERIAEVLLGSVTPVEFMIGKVIGSLGVSLTTSVIYIGGAVFTLGKMNMGDMIPYHIIPWFFIYMLMNIIMVGSIMAALGATCNDSKDAQAMQFPVMLPIIIPLFVMMPIILNPLGKMATGLSLFPLWTPMLMMLRQTTAVTIPLWQPIVGLAGVIIFTVLCVWAGARIFRSAIILQGKRPGITTLFKYIVRG